jgi:YARHG domain
MKTHRRNSRFFFMAAVAGALLSGFPVPALAQDPASMSCDELWQARNQIYKDEHFCFKTERAQRFFGNEGCIEPFPGLRHWEQERVNELQMWESRKGC